MSWAENALIAFVAIFTLGVIIVVILIAVGVIKLQESSQSETVKTGVISNKSRLKCLFYNNSALVNMADCDSTQPGQIFSYERAGNWYHIRNKQSGYCLTGDVSFAPCDAQNKKHLFTITNDENNPVWNIFRNVDNLKCLTSAGDTLSFVDCDKRQEQHFQLITEPIQVSSSNSINSNSQTTVSENSGLTPKPVLTPMTQLSPKTI